MKKENDKKVDEQMSEEIRLHSQCDNPSSSHIKHRRKKVKIIITVVCCISVMVAGGLCALKYINNGNDNVHDTYSEYNSFMEGFTDVRITDEETAIEAVASVADVLGIDDAKNELKISNINAIGGDNYYCLQQYYNDIPVYGRTISVAADKDGTASALTSNFNRIEEKIELEPAVSKEDIEKSVKEYLGIDNVEIQQFSSENLVIYNLDNTNATLAYNLSVGGTDSVIVDAKTAEILLYKRSMNDVSAEVQSKDGTVTSIGWRNDDGSYHLYNDEYKIEVFDVNGITTVLDDNGDGKIDEKDQGKVHTNFKEYGIDTMYSKSNKFEKDAVILLNETIGLSEYYKNFEFEGFERVHVAINDSYDNGKNARGGGGLWEGVKGAIMLMGDKFDFSCRGVMAHEYTHAVTGLIVGWNGKKLENSALNEAYSDVFGALYENSNNPDWKIEHLSKVERDLTDPEKTNGYDNMSDINAKDEYDQYTLSTIISHSAYLMWNGIDGQDNRKIDSTTLGNIWYRSMFLLQSNADFKQCRNAIELSARIMLRNKEITDEQYKTVISAFEEVGVENATFTFSKTVKNSFDLSVLNSDGTEDVNYKLEVIQMPKIITGPGIKNNQAPKTIMEKTSLEGRQHLDLKDGTYVLRLTDVSDDRNISQAINIKIVVNGNNASAADEVIINTDFTDVIVVVLNESNTPESNNTADSNDNLSINGFLSRKPFEDNKGEFAISFEYGFDTVEAWNGGTLTNFPQAMNDTFCITGDFDHDGIEDSVCSAVAADDDCTRFNFNVKTKDHVYVTDVCPSYANCDVYAYIIKGRNEDYLVRESSAKQMVEPDDDESAEDYYLYETIFVYSIKSKTSISYEFFCNKQAGGYKFTTSGWDGSGHIDDLIYQSWENSASKNQICNSKSSAIEYIKVALEKNGLSERIMGNGSTNREIIPICAVNKMMNSENQGTAILCTNENSKPQTSGDNNDTPEEGYAGNQTAEQLRKSIIGSWGMTLDYTFDTNGICYFFGDRNHPGTYKITENKKLIIDFPWTHDEYTWSELSFDEFHEDHDFDEYFWCITSEGVLRLNGSDYYRDGRINI